MKKIVSILIICLLLSACSVPAAQPPVSAASSPSAEISPSPAPSASPSPEESEFAHFTKGYLIDSKAFADKYRTRVGDTEYYFDTDYYIATKNFYSIDFPLYMKRDGSDPEYLGITGFQFKIIGKYIYVNTDQYGDGDIDSMVRVVDLDTRDISYLGPYKTIYISAEGDRVYYFHNDGTGDYIYSADASMKNAARFHIKLPVIGEPESAVDPDGAVYTQFSITDVKDEIIYFRGDVFAENSDLIYSENYMVSINGGEAEKINNNTDGYEGSGE